MIKKIPLIIFFFLIHISGCSFQETLNMQSFSYWDYPGQINWLLLPGFHLEHLVLTKFYSTNLERPQFWENTHCVGNSFEYNLYDNRPMVMDSIVAQLSGSKNIIKACPQSKEFTPLWHPSYKGHKIALLEIAPGMTSSNTISLTKLSNCPEFSKFDSVIYFKMDPNIFHSKGPKIEEKVETFNSQQKEAISAKSYFKTGKVYYDSSCQGSTSNLELCNNSVLQNIEFIHHYLKRNEEQFIFIIIDYRYLMALEHQQIETMASILLNYGPLFESIQQQASRYNSSLSIVTGPNPLIFPWEYNVSKKNLIFSTKDQTTKAFLSPVFVKGARAENFCGVYDQSEIVHRFLLKNNKDKLLR